MSHIAVIPARLNSVGIKFKNRFLFDNTANFIDSVSWLNETIISTDDPIIKTMGAKRGYSIHNRPDHLTGPDISIKQVFVSVIEDMNIKDVDVLWLFYLPIPYKNIADFNYCKTIIDNIDIQSLCSFIPVKTHPFDCWFFDESKKKLSHYIPNDVFRRQDKPPAWEHYHYVSCFEKTEILKLNNELININTHPHFLDDTTVDNLIELDTMEDYEKWKKFNSR